jgi:hypothetical protein
MQSRSSQQEDHTKSKPTSREATGSTTAAVEPIVTVYPTEEEFKDPHHYVQSLRKQSQHGVVKIVPPGSWRLDFSLDLEKLTLHTVRQALVKEHDDLKIAFYKDLVNFHRNMPLLRLPSIDKKPIDLYNLRRCVLEKGGFDEVCRRKQWAQIGRELGYTNRVMTSLSTSLKMAYLKILSTYDESQKGEQANSGVPSAEPSEERNDENKRPMDIPNESSKKSVMSGKAAYITNSKHSYQRPISLLKSKGIKTNFDSWTYEKLGITMPDNATFPHYDFHFWHRGKEVLDHFFPGSQLSTEITFKSFNERYPRNSTDDDETLITQFWDSLKNGTFQTLDVPAPMSSSIVGTGFPTLDSLKQVDLTQALDPWNLNNLPLNKDGLIRYLPNDNENLACPRIAVGTKNSVTSYALEDHDAYLCDYHHLGSAKVWYFISPADRLKYEAVLKKLSVETSIRTVDFSGEEFMSEAMKRDILDGIDEEEKPDKRAELNHADWMALCTGSEAQINPNLIMSPELLAEHGIKCRYVIQKPGEFIVKFPESYGMTVSLGVNLTESVHFLPPDWLDIGSDSDPHVVTPNYLPSFSYFQLLVNIVEESKDPVLLRKLYPHFNSLLDEELSQRLGLKDSLTHLKLVHNKLDYISDSSLKCTLPTKVVIKTSPSISLVFSSRDELPQDELVHSSNVKYELHVYYTDDKLKTLQKNICAVSQTPEDWVQKFNELLSSDTKPQLKLLKTLYSESEHILGNLPEAYTLKEYLDEADSWVERAQGLLNAKQKNRIRNRKSIKGENSEEKFQFELDELESLVRSITKLDFSCPEIDQVMELASEVSIFESSARSFLTEDGHTLDQFSDMIDLGRSFGIISPTITMLERIKQRLGWLEHYDVMMKSSKLEELEEFLNKAYEVCGSGDQLRVHDLENKVAIGKQWCQRMMTDLESSTISHQQIGVFIKMLDQLPSYQFVSDKIQEIQQKHTDVIQTVDDIFTVLGSNAADMADLRNEKHRKDMKDPTFKLEFYNSLVTKFSGTETDPRPLYSATREAVERVRDIQSVEGVFILENYLKQAGDWWRKMKKLFGKINSPFPMMKQHLSDLRDKNAYALSLTDCYVPDLPDEKHVIYCFCRRMESGVMIACERCNEWYHCKCLKFARGKSKQLDNYMCPVCDHNTQVPREFHCPKLEDIQEVVEDGAFLELNPDHFNVLTDLWRDALRFREFLQSELQWEEGMIVDKNVAKVRFYLRKLEGASVLLLNEYNQLKQLAWKLDQCCDGPPALVDSSNKTRKRKPKSAAIVADTTGDGDDSISGSSMIAPATLSQIIAATSLDTAKLMKIPIIQPGTSGEGSSGVGSPPIVKGDKAGSTSDFGSVESAFRTEMKEKGMPLESNGQ